MYKKTGEHKSTAMDSFAAPREEGLIVNILNNFGFAQSEGGRFAAGLKYDFVKAIDNVASTELADDLIQMIGSETARLQAARRTTSSRVTIPQTPEGVLNMISSGKMSADDVKKALAMWEEKK